MVTISVEEIQSNLQAYLNRVEAGETVVITRADRPVAEIKPVSAGPRGPRPFGLAGHAYLSLVCDWLQRIG